MLEISLATSSGTRSCDACEQRITNRTILLYYTVKDSFALHPECARKFAISIQVIANGHN